METKRRSDLDWIRVLAFGLLILYHIGMFFVSWKWHIKNNQISNSIEVPMLFVNQWRLHLLFIISGMGSYYALSNRTFILFVIERHNRLLIPLVFGMIFIVAPQVYIERIISGATSDSFYNFYPHYFEGAYPNGNFSWHHLWFLPYLFVYSAILYPVFHYIKKNPDCKFICTIKNLFNNTWNILLLLIPLTMIEIIMKPYFPTTHNLVNDWYVFTLFLFLYFYGFIFNIIGDVFWMFVEKYRKLYTIFGLFTFSAIILFTYCESNNLFLNIIHHFIVILNMWFWIIAILGFGTKYLNTKRNYMLKYLNQSVFPLYMLHQTVIVILAFFIYDKNINITAKFTLLTAATFLICFSIFEIIKRFRLTRVLFGIKPMK